MQCSLCCGGCAAADDVEINGLLAVDTGFTAKAKGRIYETESGVLQTKSGQDKVELEAGRGIALDNKDNSFVRLVVHGTENAAASGGYNAIDGNVSITVNGDREWKVMAPELTDEAIPVKGILATIGSPVNGNVSLTNVAKDAIEAEEGSINVTTGEGNIHIGDSGETERTVYAKKDILLETGLGKIDIHGKTETAEGDISLQTVNGNIQAGNLTAGNLVYAGTSHGDIILDLANAKAVVIRMPDNTPASRIGTIQAEAGGPGVTIQGKYIYAGNILSKGGSGPLTVDLQAPDGKATITDVVIDNLSSGSGTVVPKLWADRGFIRANNGYLAFGDIYTTDKIHAENPETSFALYGRTPTGDGEPHMYWNNIDLPHRTTPLLLAGSHVYTRMVDLLDENTYTWLFERDYLKYILEPEKPWTKHTGKIQYDPANIVSGQRANASGRELLAE